MAGNVNARRKANRRWIRFIMAVALLLAVMAVAQGTRLSKQNAELLKEEKYLSEQIAEETERSEELDEYSKYINTEEFAEWYAREKMGLIHKNEIIFKGE